MPLVSIKYAVGFYCIVGGTFWYAAQFTCNNATLNNTLDIAMEIPVTIKIFIIVM